MTACTTPSICAATCASVRKERELISERTRAALTAAKARGAALGGDRGYGPAAGPDSGVAALARSQAAEQAAHCLMLVECPIQRIP